MDIVQIERTGAVSLALTKQHLAPGTTARDGLTVARNLVGLHATDPFSPYLQLWARMDTFAPAMLDDLLYEEPRLARMGAMRGTLFLEPLDLLPIAFVATRRMRARGRERFLTANGFDTARYVQVAERVEAALTGRALSAREIRVAVGVSGPLTAVLNTMADEARIVRWRPVGGRRDSTPRYRLFREALPGVDLTGLDEAPAIARLVEFYVRRYGPATEDDLAWWSGIDRASLRAALDRDGDEVATVRITGLGERYLIARDDLAKLAELPEPHGVVSFLPILDPFLMGYRDRRRFVEPHLQGHVFDRGGNATSTIEPWQLSVSRVPWSLACPAGVDDLRARTPAASRESTPVARPDVGHDLDERLAALLALVQQADGIERISYRDEVAGFARAAIEPMSGWLTDPRLGAFATRVLEKIAVITDAETVDDVLRTALPHVSTPSVRDDIAAALRRLEPQIGTQSPGAVWA